MTVVGPTSQSLAYTGTSQLDRLIELTYGTPVADRLQGFDERFVFFDADYYQLRYTGTSVILVFKIVLV